MAKRIEGLKSAPTGNNTDGMVFKVQITLASNLPRRDIYVYNKDKSIVYLTEYTKELQQALADEPKSYWFGYVNAEKRIVLTSKAPWQEW
jgi:hypothetical protein